VYETDWCLDCYRKCNEVVLNFESAGDWRAIKIKGTSPGDISVSKQWNKKNVRSEVYATYYASYGKD